MMSPASSGGVFSSATLMALTTALIESLKASRISESSMVRVRGMPEIMSRPLIIVVRRSCSG